MHFKKLRAISACTSAISVTTRERSEIIIKKSSGCLPEDSGCFPTAVVIRHPKFVIIFDPYRYLPTYHGNCRSSLYPRYVISILLEKQILFSFNNFMFHIKHISFSNCCSGNNRERKMYHVNI